MTNRQSWLVASDLDRTLIYSRRSAELPPDSPASLRLVERDTAGEPLSYLTERAALLLAELADRAVFVPVTTRTVAQYRRVRLPGAAGSPAYAICANGGRLLVAGEPDRDWDAVVADRLAASGAPLAEVVDRLAGSADPAWTLKRRVAEELFAYLVVDRALLPRGWLAELTAWCAERGWGVSLQGRKVYAVPTALTKSAAVAEVVRRVGAGGGDGSGVGVLAAGDSLLDADLLLAADLAWRPGHGELADQGWTAPHVTALARRGALAGEEIVAAFLARV
ncbi:HAD family hydrolase [Kitasatospora sp. NBC_01287]|uniref:HAD family hydrolase n=1 Tax=Kitasatospora sp. NBC_01287 TaxID=2903573 RepID=UPI002259B324|nr:HAD family hydrolase [Kitasatospora sp. NBC_01287]MCX4749322.1 HAD family hydrolase [Kitasatospora sp. NBC_01287]